MAETFLNCIGYIFNIREHIMDYLKNIYPRKKRMPANEFTRWGIFILILECIGTIYDLSMTIPIYILGYFFNLNPFSCLSISMASISIGISIGIGVGVGAGVGLNCDKAAGVSFNTTNSTNSIIEFSTVSIG
ncbi:unnamed protein product [Adineta ricciae]|uniref:Uncharacterized protein n=1 Tax=Adineta ricciae TaxID=249248 RepID=A0A815MLY8_ADIRI|nr:unnamed protein product [Adineta ricciae]